MIRDKFKRCVLDLRGSFPVRSFVILLAVVPLAMVVFSNDDSGLQIQMFISSVGWAVTVIDKLLPD